MRLALIFITLLTGCHMRVASPHLYRAPDTVTCIVVVHEKDSAEVLKVAAEICKDAIEEERKP